MDDIPNPPYDRYCDLVMKGGITSGIVYPRAIGRLARHYRFKSIGGTSAGAIAAAVTAAAEYRRTLDGSRDGFALLEKLPVDLGTSLPGTDTSKLLSLFQPQRGTRRLFFVLVRCLNSTGTTERIRRVVGGFLLGYWPATLGSAALSVAVGALGADLISCVLLFALTLPASIGIWVYFDLTRRVVENGFGLCTGLRASENEALTEWLHNVIQKAAGRTPDDAPLTFGDLWDVDVSRPWASLDKAKRPRSIDLRMFTTNLSHGRPYLFPLDEWVWGTQRESNQSSRNERLYFKPHELSLYLPKSVVAWMIQRAKPYALAPGRRGLDPDEVHADGALEIPGPDEMPILLAARMSLSFPLLFSAVPLHAIDTDGAGVARFRCCWFSDGGISSNFPIHLFSELVPVWPGFGIDLETTDDSGAMVYLPTQYETGHAERWTRFAKHDSPASLFGGFVSAIIGAMQNWNDNSLARMPGMRDRVARVRLDNGEGGMNLNMDPVMINKIAAKGEEAARQLVQRFAETKPDGRSADGWDENRLVRLNTLLKMLQVGAPALLLALRPDSPHATDIATLIAELMSVPGQNDANVAPGHWRSLNRKEKDAVYNLVRTLTAMLEVFADPANSIPFQPIPMPGLRVRPPL